ncbi:GPI mannosyltransferase 2 isoform X2 [Ananas comosus]|uniref:GPI mannosyltransferase 2 n=1 Tax=Ananas comosus TaxID=4615 RepID=A0A6P5G6J4_ANACO|nr:GPI mannosyltransferase 2 isoform X2 [Ananas comosus]
MAKAKAKAKGSTAHVLRVALFSRVILLTLIALWRLLFSPYDTSASLNPNCLSSSSSPSATAAGGGGGGGEGDGSRSSPPDALALPSAAAAIGSSVVWDGVYFVRIAECGYEYEQSFAFLPLLPVAISLLSRSVFAPLIPLIGYRAVLALSGYVLNNAAFVFAAVYFYRLSLLILKDEATALRASILFSFNPASVFYSSIYSESLYALFSLGGLFYLFSGAKTVAMILLALSGSARSNGALNAGYFCFQAMLQAYGAIYQKRKPILAVQAIAAGVVQSLFVFVPFLAFQAYGYLNICLIGNSYEPRPWCKAKIPLLYGFIQSHYWGVGFLRYFQAKQLPNFLLASPILSLAVCSIVHYVSILYRKFPLSSMHKEIIYAAEMKSMGTNEGSDDMWISNSKLSSKSTRDHMVRQRKQEGRNGAQSSQDKKSMGRTLPDGMQGESSIMVLPFILHLAFMTFTAFFVMHVQVATRFLSVSPPIYWFASYVLASPSSYKKWGYLICVYFVTYILLGSLLFSNFYPFT